jgi:hypothetical protein
MHLAERGGNGKCKLERNSAEPSSRVSNRRKAFLGGRYARDTGRVVGLNLKPDRGEGRNGMVTGECKLLAPRWCPAGPAALATKDEASRVGRKEGRGRT